MDQITSPLVKHPTWCAGCGNYAIWGALKIALSKLETPKENIVLVYDVGCSGNMADFNDYYGFHGLHGRAIPPAVGMKLANHDLKPVVIIGDGGCYGEGGTHFLNEMRGNHDITVLVHDNHRYSLTTGQMSPTTAKGTITKSTPEGSIEEPLNPLAIALSNHCTFVAREFAGDIPRLSQRIVAAVNHLGFSLIDIFQPCVVFNKQQGYDWYRNNLVLLDSDNHDPTNLESAWKQAMRKDKLPIGLFYQEERPAYHQQVSELRSSPLVKHDISKINLEKFLINFR
jgi:2-oxoglutarate ferredoxin oxidoreductase subunit beta